MRAQFGKRRRLPSFANGCSVSVLNPFKRTDHFIHRYTGFSASVRETFATPTAVINSEFLEDASRTRHIQRVFFNSFGRFKYHCFSLSTDRLQLNTLWRSDLNHAQ
jgi:hypothetical protein